MFANAGTAIGIIPLNKPRGLYNTSGLLLTGGHGSGNGSEFAGTIWEKRAICKVAHNESSGAFEALNTYDNAFLALVCLIGHLVRTVIRVSCLVYAQPCQPLISPVCLESGVSLLLR